MIISIWWNLHLTIHTNANDERYLQNHFPFINCRLFNLEWTIYFASAWIAEKMTRIFLNDHVEVHMQAYLVLMYFLYFIFIVYMLLFFEYPWHWRRVNWILRYTYRHKSHGRRRKLFQFTNQIPNKLVYTAYKKIINYIQAFD